MGLVVIVQGSLGSVCKVFVLRACLDIPFRFLQSLFQKAVYTRVTFRHVFHKGVEGRGHELWDIFADTEVIGSAPFTRFPSFVYRAETPVPGAVLQHTVRIEHTPGKGLGL